MDRRCLGILAPVPRHNRGCNFAVIQYDVAILLMLFVPPPSVRVRCPVATGYIQIAGYLHHPRTDRQT